MSETAIALVNRASDLRREAGRARFIAQLVPRKYSPANPVSLLVGSVGHTFSAEELDTLSNAFRQRERELLDEAEALESRVVVRDE